MRRRLAIIAVLVFVQLVSSVWAQNTPDTSKKRDPLYAEIGKAPDKARTRENPFENDPEAVAAGGNLYEQHCAECHGIKAEGRKRGPSLLVAEVQSAEPGAIFWVLTNGVVRHGMPVWSKLPEPQRWQLVTFLKSLRRPSPILVEKSLP
jgi:mono/diheme cytochrome c family protein